MDEIVEILIRILVWPFRVWRAANENSSVGTSQSERSAKKFWAAFAMGGVALLSLIAIVYWIFF